MKVIITRKRIKNMYLRVGEDGTVMVSAPLRASDSEIKSFVESRSKWIEKAIKKAVKRAENLPEYKAHPELKKEAVKELESRLGKRVPLMEELTGLKCSGWKIRDVKSYWGKCDTATRKITFNLRLVNRTEKELDYVIIHELCHLVYRGHDSRFWALVGKYMPDYKAARKSLKG